MSKIEGYCIQNGEPTPDSPVEIESLNTAVIINLKEISGRFNNGTETIEDIMNYCRNYEITFGHNTTMRVVEKKYFDKLVERIKELEAKREFKQYGDLDNLKFEEYMNKFIPKQKIIDKIEELKKQRRELGFKTYLKREQMLSEDKEIVIKIQVSEELLQEEDK